MPPDLPNDQELNLKKRARRRLVGAVALVLLMVIVLPRILQDRAALTQQEAIKITMPDVHGQDDVVVVTGTSVVEPKVEHDQISALVESQEAKVKEPAPAEISSVEAANNQAVEVVAKPEVQDVSASGVENKKDAADKPVTKPENTKVERKVDVKNESLAAKPKVAVVKEAKQDEAKVMKPKVIEPKASEPKVNEAKAMESKAVESKLSEAKTSEAKVEQKKSNSFSVQVGVYSDAHNVQQLQGKLKEIGYSTHTEKVATPKGEKIRLKAGNFSTRQDAVQAQSKIQKIGLLGMVVSND